MRVYKMFEFLLVVPWLGFIHILILDSLRVSVHSIIKNYWLAMTCDEKNYCTCSYNGILV